MARSRKKFPPPEVREHRTYRIGEAFSAAVLIGALWESPLGPSVVLDVGMLVGGGWVVEYRLLAELGDAAWK